VVADVDRRHDDAELERELLAQRRDPGEQLAAARRVDHAEQVEPDLEAEQLDRQRGLELAAMGLLVVGATAALWLGRPCGRAGLAGLLGGRAIGRARRRPGRQPGEPEE